MSYSKAQKIVAEGNLHFNYLEGRVMKINISGDEMDPRCYDRDNGQGAALKVVTALRQNQEVTFNKANPTNRMEELAAQGNISEAAPQFDVFKM